MPLILDRVPLTTPGQKVRAGPFSRFEAVFDAELIPCWTSLASTEDASTGHQSDFPFFPTVLDTGSNSVLVIPQRVLDLWPGSEQLLTQQREPRVLNGVSVPHYGAALWLHPNRACGAAPDLDKGRPISIEAGDEILVPPVTHPLGQRNYALLGAKAMSRAGLRVHICGAGRRVWLWKSSWLWPWPVRRLPPPRWWPCA